MKKWYCIPHKKEVGSYNVCGSLTDFPRGTFLAYSDCCLTTGFNTANEAQEWMESHPCKKYGEQPNEKS